MGLRNIEELCLALREFRDRYNHHWILQRLDYRTPLQAMFDFQPLASPWLPD